MYNDSNFDIATEAVLKKAFAYTKKIMSSTISSVTRFKKNIDINRLVQSLKSTMTQPNNDLYDRLKSIAIKYRTRDKEMTVHAFTVAIGVLHLFKSKKFYDSTMKFIKYTENINTSHINEFPYYCENFKKYYDDVIGNIIDERRNTSESPDISVRHKSTVLTDEECTQIGKSLKAFFELTSKVTIKTKYLLESMDVDDRDQLAKFNETLGLIKWFHEDLSSSYKLIYSLYKHLKVGETK